MTDQRNWLERLGEKIPGYGGYVQKERRRDIDKLHREHLADRLRSIKQHLNDAVRELSDTGRLMEVGPVDRAAKKLDHAENRVRFASYGYSGFFDVVKVEELQLDRLYQFDLALVQKVEQLEHLARELKSKMTTGPELKQSAAQLEGALDEFNRTFDERSRSINDFGSGGGGGATSSDPSPGGPLFGVQ